MAEPLRRFDLRMRIVACLLACVLVANGLLWSIDARRKPAGAVVPNDMNVVFVVVDDLKRLTGFLGDEPGNFLAHIYPDPVVRAEVAQRLTPNLNAFAEQSVVFTRAHAVNPVCNPSRTAMLTGLLPVESGAATNLTHFRSTGGADATTLPQNFKNNGYYTAGVGKVFHKSRASGGKDWPDTANSWTTWAPRTIGVTGVPGGVTYSPYGTSNALFGTTTASIEDYADYQNAKLIADLLTTGSAAELALPPANPFFVAYGGYLPHNAFVSPPEILSLFPIEEMAIDRALLDSYDADVTDLPPRGFLQTEKAGAYERITGKGLQLERPNPEGDIIGYQQLVKHYLAAIAVADRSLGQVLDAVEAGGHSANTAVMVVGDHGFDLGEKRHVTKNTLWEEATGTPMLLKVPGVAPKRVDTPVSLMDVYPTLNALAGLETPAGVRGNDLSPIIFGDESQWSVPVLSLLGNGLDHQAIRSDEWTLISYNDGTQFELYHFPTDPDEQNNLAGDPAYSTIMDELKVDLAKLIAGEPVGTLENPVVTTTTTVAPTTLPPTTTVPPTTTTTAAPTTTTTPIATTTTIPPSETTTTLPPITTTTVPTTTTTTVPTSDVNVSNITLFETDSIQDYTATFTLAQPDTRAVRIYYRTNPGTATRSVDYQHRQSSLLLQPGQIEGSITLRLAGDNLAEETETFELEITRTNRPDLSISAPAIITIIDDENPPDNTGPSLVEITDPSDFSVQVNPIQVSGTVTDNMAAGAARLRVRDRSNDWYLQPNGVFAPSSSFIDIPTDSTDSSSTFSTALPMLEVGSYVITVEGLDARGNLGGLDFRTITVPDITGPFEISLVGPTGPATNPIAVMGTVSDNVSAAAASFSVRSVETNLYLQPGGSFAPDYAASLVSTASADPTSGFQWSLPTLGAGTYEVVATGIDSAGNAGAQATILLDVPDLVGPFAVSIDSPGADAVVPNPITISGTVTDDVEAASALIAVQDQATGRYLQIDGTFGPVQASTDIVVSPEGETTASYTWTLPELEVGSYTITVTGIDASGNLGLAQTSRSFSVPDLEAPSAVTISNPATDGAEVSNPVVVSGVVTDGVEAGAARLSILDRGTNRYLQEDGSFADAPTTFDIPVEPTGQPVAPYSWTLPALAAGDYEISTTALDASGNTDLNVTASRTFSISDSTGPTGISITTPGQNGAAITNPVLISGSVTDDVASAAARLTLVDTRTGLFLQADGSFGQAPHSIDIATDSNDPTSSYTWAAPFLPVGVYAVSAVGIDAAGNLGSSVAARNFEVPDVTPPTATITFPDVPLGDVTNPVVVGGIVDDDTASASARVYVRNQTTLAWLQPDGVTFGSFSGPVTVDTDSNDPSAVFDFELPTLTAGPYYLVVRGNDAAGNREPTDSFDVIYFNVVVPDVTAPTATLTSPVGTTNSLANPVTIGGTATDNEALESAVIFVTNLDTGLMLQPDGVSFGSDNGPVSLAVTGTEAAVELALPELDPGEYRIEFGSVDAAGNALPRSSFDVAEFSIPNPVPTITASSHVLTESNGNQNYTVTFELNQPLDSWLRVYYRTVEGTAERDEDFRYGSSNFWMAPGQTQRDVNFVLRGDNRDEDTEEFTIWVRQTTGDVEPVRIDGTITVLDDD